MSTNRTSPYKKLQICILGQYNSKESESYMQQFHGPGTDCSALKHNPSAVLQLRQHELSAEPNSVGSFGPPLDLNNPAFEIMDHIL